MCEELTQPRPGDATAIACLLGQLLGQAPAAPQAEAQLQALCGPENVMLLCNRDAEDVINGMVMGVVCPHIHPGLSPFFVMESLVVEVHHRRQGIAKALVQTAEAWAAARGCRYLTLASQTQRTGAHRLYVSLGYTQDCAFQKFE